MKQHITAEQINTLSNKQKDSYYYFFGSISDEFPLISIGQMIEFLGWDDMQFYIRSNKQEKWERWTVQNGDYENASKGFNGIELCDALWEAVKEVLK